MSIAFSVRIDESHADLFSQRVQNEIHRAAFYEVGKRWQQKWLPRHFNQGNVRRYGYKRRSKSWQRRKQREAQSSGKVKKGGRVALVYHGDAERLLEKRHAIRAFPTRATINMHGPRYVRMTPRGRNRPTLGKEITTVIDEELQDLNDVAEKALDKAIRRSPRKKTSMSRPRR